MEEKTQGKTGFVRLHDAGCGIFRVEYKDKTVAYVRPYAPAHGGIMSWIMHAVTRDGGIDWETVTGVFDVLDGNLIFKRLADMGVI